MRGNTCDMSRQTPSYYRARADECAGGGWRTRARRKSRRSNRSAERSLSERPVKTAAELRDEAATSTRQEAADRVSGTESTLAMAERRVAEAELQIVRQKTILDAMARGNHSHRVIDQARSVLARFEDSLRFAQDHLRFERQHYGYR